MLKYTTFPFIRKALNRIICLTAQSQLRRQAHKFRFSSTVRFVKFSMTWEYVVLNSFDCFFRNLWFREKCLVFPQDLDGFYKFLTLTLSQNSALALNGNAHNCNEKLNVSVGSCSTLASLVPLLAWARGNVLYFYFILTNSCVYDKINSTREKIYGKAKI